MCYSRRASLLYNSVPLYNVVLLTKSKVCVQLQLLTLRKKITSTLVQRFLGWKESLFPVSGERAPPPPLKMAPAIHHVAAGIRNRFLSLSESNFL
jgi:hypothetical protein